MEKPICKSKQGAPCLPNYKDTFQESMATLIAMKNRATAAINGEVSSDGLSAMLGDSGDLQSMLIESVKKGNKVIKGSAEDWVSQTSDKARELLANIGKKKPKTLYEQFIAWVNASIQAEGTKNVMKRKANSILQSIERGNVQGFTTKNGILSVDLVEAFGLNQVPDGLIMAHLVKEEVQAARTESPSLFDFEIVEETTISKGKKKSAYADGQLALVF